MPVGRVERGAARRGAAYAGGRRYPAGHTDGGQRRPRPARGLLLSSLADRLEYAGYRLGTAALARVPEAPLYAAAAAGARWLFDRGGRRVRIACVNLAVALPDESEAARRELARRSFVELVWSGLDLARARRWDAEALRQRVSFHDREHMDKTIAAGRGCLVLIPHLGSLELALRAAPAHGIPITVMTKPASNPLIDRDLNADRQRAGAQVLRHRHITRQALAALRAGRPLVISNDQYERRSRSIHARFFGVLAPTGRGLAALSLRTGAPVVPVYIARSDPSRSRLTCRPPIEPVRTGDFRRDLQAMTTRYNRAIEDIVRLHPDQYLWSHKRFRNCLDLPESLYDD